jgi:hypothetical protein
MTLCFCWIWWCWRKEWTLQSNNLGLRPGKEFFKYAVTSSLDTESMLTSKGYWLFTIDKLAVPQTLDIACAS